MSARKLKHLQIIKLRNIRRQTAGDKQRPNIEGNILSERLSQVFQSYSHNSSSACHIPQGVKLLLQVTNLFLFCTFHTERRKPKMAANGSINNIRAWGGEGAKSYIRINSPREA